jgi:hypothetical protein
MIRIESSAGTMFCYDDGTPYAGLPDEYANIIKFDVRRLEKMCTANHIPFPRECGWDILALGYWTNDGEYEEPAASYSETGVMRHIWKGLADDLEGAIELGGDW